MEGFVGILCTIAILLEYTNVVLYSRRENNKHPIDCEITVSRVLPVRDNTLCKHGDHQFNLGDSRGVPIRDEC